MEHIVIIGNGISGITAARHIRKRSQHKITVISTETDHFFSRTALMYVYMGHMKYEHTKPYEDFFWKKNSIDLVRGFVNSIDYDQKLLRIAGRKDMKYDRLVLAVGSKPNKFGWPGQELDGVQGLYSYQDLQTLEKNTHAPLTTKNKRTVKRAVIVGGGLIGVELAEMLQTRDIQVTFLVREDRFWGNVLPFCDGELVGRHLRKHHINLKLGTELKEITSDEQGRCKSVITNTGEEIECQIVGLTAGVSPNIAFLKSGDLEIQRGIMVNRCLETNIPDVYAVGDCAQFSDPAPGRRAIEQVWYTGRMMGEAVAKSICDGPTPYNPGYWFNSAKFMDLEYQTYGTVIPEMPEGHSKFCWKHENEEMSIHFVWQNASRRFVGANVFGLRMRHEVFDRWLNEERSIDHVLEFLRDANFDPEFSKTHEKGIVDLFNQENGTTIKVQKRNWRRILNLTST